MTKSEEFVSFREVLENWQRRAEQRTCLSVWLLVDGARAARAAVAGHVTTETDGGAAAAIGDNLLSPSFFSRTIFCCVRPLPLSLFPSFLLYYVDVLGRRGIGIGPLARLAAVDLRGILRAGISSSSSLQLEINNSSSEMSWDSPITCHTRTVTEDELFTIGSSVLQEKNDSKFYPKLLRTPCKCSWGIMCPEVRMFLQRKKIRVY